MTDADLKQTEWFADALQKGAEVLEDLSPTTIDVACDFIRQLVAEVRQLRLELNARTVVDFLPQIERAEKDRAAWLSSLPEDNTSYTPPGTG